MGMLRFAKAERGPNATHAAFRRRVTWPRLDSGFWPARLATLVVIGALGALSFLRPARAGVDEFPEYKLKSAFLYNFAKFVTWPAQSFATPETPMTIGILGDDPFGPLLNETIKNKTVNGRPILIKHLTRNDAAKDCHILFISRSEKERIPAILASLKGKSILTVSEVDKFAHNGGAINLLVVQESIRFEINLQAAEQAGLQVSSKLWGVGIVIKADSNKENK